MTRVSLCPCVPQPVPCPATRLSLGADRTMAQYASQATELMLVEVDEVELQLETALLPPLTSPAPSASPLRPNHLQRKETTLYFCSPATFVLNKAHLEHHALAVRTNGEHAALQLLSTRLSRADHAPPEQSRVNDNNLPPDVVLCSSQTLMIF